MNTIKKITISFAVFLILFAPAFSFAANDTDIPDKAFAEGRSLVPCGGDKNQAGEIINPCSFSDAMTMIDGIIKFILKFLAIPISAISFAYAGFTMVTSGGNTEARSKAKSIFTNTAIGLLFVAGAYIIVRTILGILGFNGAWLGF